MDVGARGQGRLGLGEGPPVPAGVTPRDQGTPRALALPADMVGLSGQTSKPERCPFFLGLVEGRGGQKQDAGWVLPRKQQCRHRTLFPWPPPASSQVTSASSSFSPSHPCDDSGSVEAVGSPVLGSGPALSLAVWPGPMLPVFLTAGSWEVMRVRPLTAPVVTGRLTRCKQPCEVGGLRKAQRTLAACARSQRGKVCVAGL